MGRTRQFRLGATFIPDPEPEVPPGSLLGAQERYRVVRLLGQGGMGRVYEARREHDGRPAAVKVLRTDRVGKNLEESIARFRQEAAAAGRVGHAGIVEIYGFERTPDGRVVLAMELLEGMTFEDWMSSEGTLAEGLALVAQFCDALHAAHEAGIVHRDIKPENLFLHQADGRVRPTILDFGLAKVDVPDHTQIETAAGTVLGTPYYLAPERALGKPLTRSADLYSLGVVLYELVAGVLPFDGNAFMAILEGHVRRVALDPRQAAPERPIPDAMSTLVMALLSKDPALRPATAAEVALQIRQLLRTEGEALARCPTGPRATAMPDADTMSMLALAHGHTAAPVYTSATAATVPPHGAGPSAGPSVVQLQDPAPRRRLGLVVGLGALVGVTAAAGFVGLQPSAPAADPPAQAAPPEVVSEAPAETRPAPAALAPIESVVAIPKPRPAADESAEAPSEPPSANRAGGGTNAAAKKRRPKPETQAPEPPPSSLPAFKDDVYD